MAERVRIRGTVGDTDPETLVIETPTATYHYDMEGGGFSSLVDRDGRDWIGYRPGDGPAGEYRGIPNMVFRGDAGGFFHPGHTGDMGSATQLVVDSPEAVTLKTTSANGLWQVQWDICPGHARMRVLRANPDDGAYWFLYEGTPGGAFEPERSLCVRCTGESTPLSEPWEADLPSPAWVAFTDAERRRSLFLCSEKRSRGPDMYKPMAPMTVFGFGRRIKGVRPHITDVGNAFYIGLVESAEYAAVARTVSALR